MLRFSESPEPMPGIPGGYDDKIMHATFPIGSSTLMASDSVGNTHGFAGFSLSLNTDSKEQAHQWFEALAQNGKVIMPLEKTFWAELFGMVTDQFGMEWMINVDAAQPT